MENAGEKPNYLQFQNFLPERIFLRFPAMVVANRLQLRFDAHSSVVLQPPARGESQALRIGGGERDGDWAHVNQSELRGLLLSQESSVRGV
jgi:hypothetical protein